MSSQWRKNSRLVKLSSHNLSSHLAKTLAPIYLISGDEHLLVSEASDDIRQAARKRGYSERELYSVERGFDWQGLSGSASALSLFSDQRIIEVRMPTGKAGKEGGAVLLEFANNPPPDTVVLIITGKLDRSVANTKWVKAIEKKGAHLQIWPIEIERLPAWINQRMRQSGLIPEGEAVQLITERVEGNLLAAKQEVDKLLLLNGPGTVSSEVVAEAVADSSRYDIFKCVDAALLGNLGRCLRILSGLRGEGVEPVLMVWALARELQALTAMAWERDRGVPTTDLLSKVWVRRKPLISSALGRHSLDSFQQMVIELGRVDRIVKGQLYGKPWDALTALVSKLANRKITLQYATAV